jgi:hypothetical protein
MYKIRLPTYTWEHISLQFDEILFSIFYVWRRKNLTLLKLSRFNVYKKLQLSFISMGFSLVRTYPWEFFRGFFLAFPPLRLLIIIIKIVQLLTPNHSMSNPYPRGFNWVLYLAAPPSGSLG